MYQPRWTWVSINPGARTRAPRSMSARPRAGRTSMMRLPRTTTSTFWRAPPTPSSIAAARTTMVVVSRTWPVADAGAIAARLARRRSRMRVASGEWRVASGEWRVASGEWRVASGEWRVASGEWRAKLRRGGAPVTMANLPVRCRAWRLPAHGEQVGADAQHCLFRFERAGDAYDCRSAAGIRPALGEVRQDPTRAFHAVHTFDDQPRAFDFGSQDR